MRSIAQLQDPSNDLMTQNLTMQTVSLPHGEIVFARDRHKWLA